jgi:hypothetical protein
LFSLNYSIPRPKRAKVDADHQGYQVGRILASLASVYFGFFRKYFGATFIHSSSNILCFGKKGSATFLAVFFHKIIWPLCWPLHHMAIEFYGSNLRFDSITQKPFVLAKRLSAPVLPSSSGPHEAE